MSRLYKEKESLKFLVKMA